MTPSLPRLIAKGESATLELKRSTGELRQAMQTLCAFAFANGKGKGNGGRVIVGVKPSGELVGQQVSEQTFHEIAAQRDRFEPPIEVESVEVAPGRSALVLAVARARDSVPLTFDGRAHVFHRTGLIEKWGRGTNRVAEMCTAAGTAPPEFEEITGAAVVTFRVPVAGAKSRAESGAESRAESRAESLDERILETLRAGEQSKSGLATKLGVSSVTGQLNRAVAALLEHGLVEMTIPDKPNSRLQKYRLTAAGRAAAATARGA